MTFAEAMAAGSRLFDVRATITCVDLTVINATGSHIMGFTVDDGGQMPLGTAMSARYTLDLSNAGGEWLRNGAMLGNRSLTGARVKVEMAVHHDGAWDWQPVGVFIVNRTSAPEQDTRMKLVGNDPLSALDVVFDDTLVYRSTTTLNDILTHIRSKGVTINGTLATNGSAIVNFTPDWGDDATIRTVLCYVAQMGGCFVRCDRDGVVELVPLNGVVSHAITTSTYLNFTDDERYFNFNRIKVQPLGAKKDKEYVQAAVNAGTPESAANTLVIENNPLFKTRTTYSYYKASTWREGRQYYTKAGSKYTAVAKDEAQENALGSYYQRSTTYNTANLQTMVTNLKTALTGVAFRAIDFTWLGNPEVRVGDKVTLTDTRSVTTTAIIVQQRMSFDGGTLRAQVSCPLDLEAVTPATITASGRVVSTSFGVGTIDGSVIIPQSMTGAHLIDGTITNSNIAGGTITGTEIADSTIKNSHFQDGTISGSIFEDGTITGSKIDASTFTNGQISGTAIDTSTFTNGSISGTAIDASTFTNGTISGSVIDTSTFVDGTIDGSKITDSTIENSHFVAGTIEGSSIKGGTIDGTHIYSGTADNLKITNAHIQNGAITTAKIQDAQITNAKIASAGIDFLKVKNSVLDTAIFREIVAGGDVYIDRLKVADANITNLTVGNLMVKRPDGTLHRIYVDGNGDLQTELVEVLYQNLSSDALLKVSEWTVYKKETAPTSPYVGQLWVKPSTGIMQKCLTITPSVTWGDVKAGELHTSYIDAVTKGLNILTGGELNVLGGSVNIKSLDGVANIINMDNTGLTLSSTGQLKLQSTDSIIIGGSPFGVGGTNLLKNSDFVQGSYSAWTNWANYSDAILTKHSMSIDGVKQSGNVTCPAGDTVVGISQYVNCPQPYGDNVTLSFYGYILQSILTGYGENRCVLITQYDAVGTEIPSSQVVIYPSSFNFVPGENRFYRLVYSFSPHTDARTMRVLFMVYADGTNANNMIVTNFQLEKGPFATDWSPSPQDTVDALAGIGTSINGLQTQIDGKIVAYWQTSDPSTGWTAQQKIENTGDMWYDTDAPSNALKRWNGTGWDVVSDESAVTAYKLAAAAKDTADGKRRVFTTTPTPPYDVGDLWAGGSTGDLKRCSAYKAAGDAYAAGDWVLASKYTDDTTATAAAAAASAAQGVADTAASNATNALAQLSDISADSKLTPVEKKSVKKEWEAIAGEKSRIDTEADEFSVSKTAYGTAYNTLNTYLNGASGLLLNLNTTSTIVAATFRSNFTSYYNARQDLLNAITSKAKTLADSAQTNLTNFINNTYTPAIASKTTVFYGTSKPTYTAVGDIWYESANGGMYRCTNVSTQAHTEITSDVLKQALSAATAAQTTANGKINTFVGSTTPSANTAGDLWMDTGNKNIWKRATAAGTGGWVQYLTAAGYLITTGITIDGTDLTVKATGNLNLAADGNLNVQNGGNLNVLNGGDIEINNGGDINVASGGKINVSATDLMISGKTVETYASDKIRLEVQVGGNNLIKNGDFTQGTYSSWTNWVAYSDAVLSKHSQHVDKTKQSGNVTCSAPDTVAGIYQTVPCPDTGGKELTFSMYGYLMDSIITRHGSGNCGLITQYNSGGTEISGTQTQLYLSDFGPYNRPNSWYRLVKIFTPHADCASLRVLFVIRSDGTNDNNMIVTNFQLEKGTIATDWSPAPSDPASGVKTSYIDIATDHIDISTGGNINLSAGAKLSAKTGTIQLEAANSSGSVLQFGDALNISEGSSGYQLSINSATNDAIKVNNNPVWHKGNIVVQEDQPASGNGVIWVRPLGGTATVNYVASLASNLEYAGGGTRSWTLSNTTGDTMSNAGTYKFTVTFKLQRTTINQRTLYINTTGGSIVLTKGAGSLTIALPALEFGPWWQHTVSVTGTTTSTAFTSGTGTISAAITLTGTPSYGADDFIQHVRPSDIACKIDGPGASGTAQSVEIKFVP